MSPHLAESRSLDALAREAPAGAAAWAALEQGDVEKARRLIADALPPTRANTPADDWEQLRHVTAWPDAWLVAAVRCDPPDAPALDALVSRYWKTLYGRCELLTLDRDTARDLAQETWARVLRARHRLQPDDNFRGYLTTIATNLWRDRHRSARRAGQLAEQRLVPLDATMSTNDGDTVVLAEALPDLDALSREEQAVLKMDVDRALARLTPRSRDVLTARYFDDESAAEIGRRYGRTEQTITAWVRSAVREIRQYLGESPRGTTGQDGR